MEKIVIYYEGEDFLAAGLRDFIERFLKSQGVKRFNSFNMIAGEDNPVRDFKNGIRSDPDAFHILLMDADELPEGDYRALLQQTPYWKTKPVEVEDEQLHFMVRKMESWFIADYSNLLKFFNLSLLPAKYPKQKNVEKVPQTDVDKWVNLIAEKSNQKTYLKGRHSVGLLKAIEPTVVSTKSDHCRQFLNTLKQKLNDLK